MAAISAEATSHIEEKYRGSTTVISKQIKHSRPVAITAISALGRSSIYNRLKFRDRLLYTPVGFTQGYGHFQFSNALFRDLCELLRDDGDLPGHQYGRGPNWRMRTLRIALTRIGVEPELLRHGVRRQVFVAPLARNWKAYLRGDSDEPLWYSLSLDEMAAHFRHRWAGPRSRRDPSFRSVVRTDVRLSDQAPA